MTDYKDSRPCEPTTIDVVTVIFVVWVVVIAFLGVIGNMNIEHKQEISQIKSTCGGGHGSI